MRGAVKTADHAPTNIKFEEVVSCQCHFGYRVDGTIDGHVSFTTTCDVAARALSATRGIAPLASRSSVAAMKCSPIM